jgi:hypothetical protein
MLRFLSIGALILSFLPFAGHASSKTRVKDIINVELNFNDKSVTIPVKGTQYELNLINNNFYESEKNVRLFY